MSQPHQDSQQNNHEDKLAAYRLENSKAGEKFFNWVRGNCTKATSAEDVRRRLSRIKKPLREFLEK